ncbi:MAG: DUF4250 domain-containing protein [Oscillospiraceae bacterium]|nr:DUF4250 domain-containing protein [Oscillospiraceae bacterium]
MKMSLPKDPAMLLSVVNTKLRDFYPSLDELCRSEDVSRSELEQALASLRYVYREERNQFVRQN